MKFVAIVLLLSILSGLDITTDTISQLTRGVEYELYVVCYSLPFIVSALVGVLFCRITLARKQFMSTFVVGSLVLCMSVTAIKGLLFVFAPLDPYLREFALSWKPIYHAVEVLAFLIVGGNGLCYLGSVAPCNDDSRSDIMFNNHPNH